MTIAPLCRRLAASAGLLFAATAAAAPVGFDDTFGPGGKAYANLAFIASDDIAQAVAIQPNGAVVVAGTCHTGSTRDFCVARFLANGDLDPSFGSGGKVGTAVGVGEDVARAITLDGSRIVVAGSCTQGGEIDFCVVRYLPNGALDTSFNGTGMAITPVGLLADYAYAVAMDGTSILVAGECEVEGGTDSCLLRYLADGTVDTSYGSGGRVFVPMSPSSDGIRGLAVAGGQAVFAAYCFEFGLGSFCIARLNADGTLDGSFGASGKVVTALTPFGGFQRIDSPNALALLTDGRIVAAGQCRVDNLANHGMCALVLNADGTPSTAVNGDGRIRPTIPTATTAAATGVATIGSSEIYLAGPCTVSGVQRFCVAGLNGLGGLSITFNAGQPLVDTLNLSVDAVPNAVAAEFNGNTDLVVAGACGSPGHDFCVARYLQTGARQTGFGVLGVKVQELTLGRWTDYAEGLARQPDGRIVVGGTCAQSRACIARFNSDGTLDASFAAGGIYIDAPGSSAGFGSKVAADATGVTYVAQLGGSLRITRLLADGSPDLSWGGTGMVSVATPGVTPTKISGVELVGGGTLIGFACESSPFTGFFCLVRLDAAGALDPAFNAAGAVPGFRQESFLGNNRPEAMALDGSFIVMAGGCGPGFSFNPCVMKFTSAGVPDTTFNGTGKRAISMGTTTATLNAVSVSAGVITVGGGCTPGTKEDFCLARITANGALDTTFNGTGIASLSMGPFKSQVQALVADGSSVVAIGACAKDALPGGYNDVCLARFVAGGFPDVNFNGSGSLRAQVGTATINRGVTGLIRDGPRFVASVHCLPANGDGVSDFCLGAWVELPASLPGAPTINGMLAGDGQATVSFVPPADNGGSTITSYTATCGAQSASGPASPLVVTGLLNGVSVPCAVTATNSAGTGPASDPPVNVTPLRAPTLTLTANVNPSSATGTVRFSTTVGGQSPTGSVTLKLPGGETLPNCNPAQVVAGVASCSVTGFFTPGTYSITAHYSGDAANAPAVSAPLSHTVIATFEQLTITKQGSGAASVTSAPAGITCGATCTSPFPTNTAVTLTATPGLGTSVSWLGCTVPANGNECLVVMFEGRAIELTLTLLQFPLTVAKAGTGAGSVESSPAGIDCGPTCGANLPAGTVATLTASAAAGSVFAGWSGACSGTGACQVTMDAVKDVTATFNVTPSFLLTVIKAGTGTGTVASSPAGTIDCGATCSASLVSGTVVQLVATPAAGSTFASWSGACAGSGACSVTVDAAKTVTATFSTIPSFTLTVAKAGTGTGTVVSSPAGTIDCGATCSASLLSGTVVQLVATPAAGSTFASWSGACAGSGACSVTVDAAKAVTATFDTTNPPRLGNISTRGQVLTGNDVMIGGFVIGGSADKTVVVRARGPSLVPFGITNALANPALQLVRSSDQVTIATNDDWGTAGNAAAVTASGFAPGHALEAAILMTLPPGAYTAIVTGAGNGTGVGIVEVFEVDHPETPLANISTRGQVLSGNDVMIGGFVINGDAAQTVVVRARGPSLVPFGITNALANPSLQLVRSSDQVTLAVNDDWGSDANAAALSASGFAPSNALESAILITLPPGAYTVIVNGAGGGTGVGIVEVFAQ